MTSCCSALAIRESSDAAFCVLDAPCVVFSAAVATAAMFCEICPDPRAASPTLRATSPAVAVCSSTELASVVWMSLI